MGKRLSRVAKEFGVGVATLVSFLKEKGYSDVGPNSKIEDKAYELINEKFKDSKKLKEAVEKKSKELEQNKIKKGEENTEEVKSVEKTEEVESEEEEDIVLIKDNTALEDSNVLETPVEAEKEEVKIEKPKVLGKINLDELKKKPSPKTHKKEEVKKETKDKDVVEQVEESKEKENVSETEKKPQIKKPKVLGKIEIEDKTKKKAKKANKKLETKEKKNSEEKEKKVIHKEKDVQTISEEKDTGKTQEIKNEQEQVPEEKHTGSEKEVEENYIPTEKPQLEGPKVLGKIELKEEKKHPKVKKVLSSEEVDLKKSKKPKKFKKDKDKKDKKEHFSKDKEREKDRYKDRKDKDKFDWKKKKKKKGVIRKEVDQEEVEKQFKETTSRLSARQKSKAVKYRREKRKIKREQLEEELREQMDNTKIKVTEFVSVSELASLMDVDPSEVIKVCMELGLFVSINQRLDKEVIPLIAENFGYEVEFKTIEDEIKEFEEIEEDKEEDLVPRPPIVTVMGHVDHGKTKLLDYIRKTNVIAGEAGGITQHIGAYSVEVEGKKITFIDTPGHEAFTAMRARGAQVTDIALIVIAADDGVMPQTVEAINHAQAAGVEMIFVFNKIDKETANPDRIREQLANMNILVEEWGGKYMTQEISAKTGQGIPELLEKLLTLAELLELKANPNAPASGTVIESSLERGRGYVATLLVQRGTLRMRDLVVAGTHYGRVKSMFNERGAKVKEATPSVPVQVLGLDGAPEAGDKFKVVESDDIAKDITNKRKQLLREQSFSARKMVTLEELGRRLQLGSFQEVNFIIKADTNGSVEALADSILKLSVDEIKVNVIHKAVGQISENDVMLAAASDAVIIAFQVRASSSARTLAEKEKVEIRYYSIIYDVLEDIKKAMEGMLSAEVKEEVIGSAEVLQVFKVSKVGKIAGCRVVDGKIKKEANVRVLRDGVVVYDGKILSLKHYQNDVDVVNSGQECGIGIENFNDIKVGDSIEAYEKVEVKRKL